MWFSDYVFLERQWAKDEITLKVLKCILHIILLGLVLLYLMVSKLQSGFRRLEDFPMPFWLALFVEGTRFTQPKLALSQHYAASKGLPVPRNVLIPRTKVNLN